MCYFLHCNRSSWCLTALCCSSWSVPVRLWCVNSKCGVCHIGLLHVVIISVSDPEISRALNVTETTNVSVSLRWSIGNTQHIDMIQLYQRKIDESETTATNTSSTTSHTVMSLRPGTKYEFYVQIQSYGKTARTESITPTTGETMSGYWLWSQQLVVT